MAVVVQRMAAARAAGVLFTADPVTGNRKVVSVEATPGLGEALVSGLVNPDVYKVRDDEIVAKTVRQEHPALSDSQVVRIAQLGRQIEAHFGRPQDIEWCFVDDEFQIVQSRPITTLFPTPIVGDKEKHVYISVGHQQMMTDAAPPLAISVRQLTGATTFYEAGGRLFVDVARQLSSVAGRAGLLAMIGKSDPLIRGALETVIDRDFIPVVPNERPNAAPMAAPPPPPPLENDPGIVAELMERAMGQQQQPGQSQSNQPGQQKQHEQSQTGGGQRDQQGGMSESQRGGQMGNQDRKSDQQQQESGRTSQPGQSSGQGQQGQQQKQRQ